MKIIRLTIISILFLFFCGLTVNAQATCSFTYNDSGNRKHRAIVIPKSATIPNDSLLAKELEKPLDDQIGLQKTRIYPNPTKGLLRIDLPALTQQDAIIRLYDSSGKLIIQHTASEFNNELHLTAYPSGIYIMTIQIGQNDRKEWKIIKE